METVMESPKSKKKMWWQEKIEKLEAEVAELRAKTMVDGPAGSIRLSPEEIRDGVHFESYAEGYAGCLNKYALLPKEKRNIIKKNITSQGPRYLGQAAWTRMKF